MLEAHRKTLNENDYADIAAPFPEVDVKKCPQSIPCAEYRSFLTQRLCPIKRMTCTVFFTCTAVAESTRTPGEFSSNRTTPT